MTSEHMKKQYDRNTNLTEYKVGDPVRFLHPKREKGKNIKLQKPWKGPYVVIKQINDVLFRIQDGAREKPKLAHHHRLKPYQGNSPPLWFKQM